MGAFGKRLFESSDLIGEFTLAAHETEQRRKQAVGGALFFGYLLLSKQKKVTRLEAKRNLLFNCCELLFTANKI